MTFKRSRRWCKGKEMDEAEGESEELPGLKWWHKRGKGGGIEGWMRGRKGRVFEGGSCESLIPRFHQRVQIWRLLLLSSPVLKTRHGPGRKLEDRKGKGWRGEEWAVGESWRQTAEKKKRERTRQQRRGRSTVKIGSERCCEMQGRDKGEEVEGERE